MSEATRVRILEAAEVLFAEKGFRGMSMRAIAKEANCNVASANYHFRSKEGLVQEMIARRVGPINQKRFEKLEETRKRNNGAIISKKEIIDIIMRPLIDALILPNGEIDEQFLGIVSRSLTDPSPFLQKLHGKFFGALMNEFSLEVRRHYQGMDSKRTTNTMVVLATMIIGSITVIPNIIRRMNVGSANIDINELMNELIDFLSRGLPESTSK